MHISNEIDWSAIAVGLTVIGGAWAVIKNNTSSTDRLRQDIKVDVIRIDEKHEEHRKTIDERWVSLLKEIHSLDKKIEKTKPLKKASAS